MGIDESVVVQTTVAEIYFDVNDSWFGILEPLVQGGKSVGVERIGKSNLCPQIWRRVGDIVPKLFHQT